MEPRSGDLNLLEAESQRLSHLDLTDDYSGDDADNPWMRFRFAAAHSVVALLALGQATEPWYVPMLLAVVSCWHYCSTLTGLPHRSTSDITAPRIAIITAIVVVAATAAVVSLFVA